MPTFDRAPFLSRAIGSLLRQSVSDWELVIIDDGSRDRTPTVVAAYLDDPRIRCERWPRNRGLGAAANRGLDRAAATSRPSTAASATAPPPHPCITRGTWEHVGSLPATLHIHPHLDQRGWLRELSRYDAGWLHRIRSHNRGDLAAASWNDLNYPARMAPMVACGLPLLQQHSPGCAVGAENLIERLGVGVLYDRVEDLYEQLHDRAGMKRRRRACLAHRERFTFDHHVDRLLELFRTVIG